MFIPLTTQVEHTRPPMANYWIIGINVVVFLLQSISGGEWIFDLMLWPDSNFQVHQLWTAAFLHGGFWHLALNMVFLWVFGNAVNFCMGNVKYTVSYLSLAAVAGIAQVAGGGGELPIIGASGAVFGVAGLFAVLYPTVRVKSLLFIFVFFRILEVRGLWIVAAYAAFEIFYISVGTMDGIAHWAHFGGLAAGVMLALGMITVGLIPRTSYDLLSYFAGKRAEYRTKDTRGLFSDHDHRTYDHPPEQNRRSVVDGKAERRTRREDTNTLLESLSRKISTAVLHRDGDRIETLYARLLQADPEYTLADSIESEIFDFMLGQSNWPMAVAAAERYIRAHPRGPDVLRIALRTGFLLDDTLGQRRKAEPFYQAALAFGLPNDVAREINKRIAG
jgi:membrane associated rhomboid family serine protease